ncbi:Uncharacterized protein Fot_05855 [Forsythia ovata]|uniref:Uncharacterized protein n=1 Tax=Forsythia ovata TaxID=205694 RepID=A0ABD1WRA8_9LAMI
MELVFFANCQCLQNPPLPIGFYSNCFFPVTITVSNQTLTKASNAEFVKLIQEAKVGLPNEFGKWVKGKLMKDHSHHLMFTRQCSYLSGEDLVLTRLIMMGTSGPYYFHIGFESHLCCHCWLSALYEKRSPINDVVR